MPDLPLGPNPIIIASRSSKIIIIGQAPGTRVHKTGIPWNDPSGETLRKWLNITPEIFYNEKIFTIMPMGFCYPGKGKSGDLPPREECAPLWHEKILKKIKKKPFILLIGMYSQRYYLGKNVKKTLTETVKAYKAYLPDFIPLPHPSPRNNIWLKKNSWFEKKIVPALRKIILSKMNDTNH